jgi:hypothetical protein
LVSKRAPAEASDFMKRSAQNFTSSHSMVRDSRCRGRHLVRYHRRPGAIHTGRYVKQR